MEGVLVSAKKAGSTVTITVVSDKDGRFSFPASKIEPGQYALRIRAIGYDLDNHKSIEVAAQKTTTPISSSARPRISRRRCRTPNGSTAFRATIRARAFPQLRRLPHARARHALDPHADEFLKITLPRMQSYVNQSIPQPRSFAKPSG